MINDLLKMKLITNSDSSSSCNHFHFSLPTRLVVEKFLMAKILDYIDLSPSE